MSVQLQFWWNQFLLIFIFNEGHCFPGRLEQVFLNYFLMLKASFNGHYLGAVERRSEVMQS